MFIKRTKFGKIRVDYRIKPHAPPLGKAPANSIKF